MLRSASETKRHPARSWRWLPLAAAVLLLPPLLLAIGVLARCSFAREAVRFGGYFAVGPRCTSTGSSVIVALYDTGIPSPPARQYWRAGGEWVLGKAVLQLGPFTLYREQGSMAAASFSDY